MLEAETATYQWIDGKEVGPAFLGHLTEESRVIGFIISRITDFRHATPDDFALCCKALSKLHDLGIKHGDTNKHNFLAHDTQATLIDFDSSSRVASSEELEMEMGGLQDQLADMSGRGGRIIIHGTSSPNSIEE